MNRRTLLKSLLLSPLLGLLKSRKSGARVRFMKGTTGGATIIPTTGTSGGGSYLMDPQRVWAEEAARHYNKNKGRVLDDAIIKSLGAMKKNSQ